MIKKIFYTKLLIVLLVFSLSAKAATYWNVAAFIWTGTAIAVTAAAMAGAAPIFVAGTLAVGFHAGVLGIYWDDTNPPLNSSSQPTPKGVSVIIDSKTPLVTPSNWTAGTAANNYEPSPPSSGPVFNTTEGIGSNSSSNIYYVTYDAVNKLCPAGSVMFTTSATATQCVNFTTPRPFPSKQELIDNLQNNSTYCGIQCTITTNDQTNANTTYYSYSTLVQTVVVKYRASASNQTLSTYQQNVNAGCPAGYVFQKSASNVIAYPPSCVLSDSTIVNKPYDDVCEMQLRTGKFVKAIRDPDCAKNLVTGDQSNTVAAVTPSKAIYLVTSTTGDVTVYEKRFDEATNKTITNIGNFGNDGNLNYLQTVNALGNSVSVNPVTGQVGNVAGSGGSGSGGSSDAKDASLNVVAGGDDDIGNGTSDTGGVAAASNGLSTSLNPLKTWALPSHTGTCPTGSFDALGKTYTFDKFCDLMNQYLPVVRSAMGVVYTLAAFFIILGA